LEETDPDRKREQAEHDRRREGRPKVAFGQPTDQGFHGHGSHHRQDNGQTTGRAK